MAFIKIRGSKPVWFAVFGAALAPLVFMILAALLGRLGADPVKTLTHETGIWAINCLVLTLSISPLSRFLNMPRLVMYRRQLGLWCYFYACLHVTVFYALLLDLDLGRLGKELAERPYITMGFTAWLIFAVMAVTSIPRLVRKLGPRRWRRLHKIVFAGATFAVVHFLWLSRSDFGEALGYGAAFALLVAARLYYSRQQVAQLWRRWSSAARPA